MQNPPSTVFELRTYTLHPGQRDVLIDLFEREFIEPQEDLGIELPGLFRDAERPDRFVWLRGFTDMASRERALSAFYGGAVWRAHRDAANATMIDSDNVLLLAPAQPAPDKRAHLRGPLFSLTYACADTASLAAFAIMFSESIAPALRADGASIVASFMTHPEPNNFPQLPVRENEHVFVAIVDGAQRESFLACPPSEIAELVPAARSHIQVAYEGTAGDFDFLVGAWNVHHRKLKARLSNCTEWETYDGSAQGYSLLDGLLSVDEIVTGPASKGCSVRNLDLARKRWTIHWANSRGEAMANPVHGGFRDARGEFYGTETLDGTPTLVRYIWSACDGPEPRWEQAFSLDGGATWESNWVMEFRRP